PCTRTSRFWNSTLSKPQERTKHLCTKLGYSLGLGIAGVWRARLCVPRLLRRTHTTHPPKARERQSLKTCIRRVSSLQVILRYKIVSTIPRRVFARSRRGSGHTSSKPSAFLPRRLGPPDLKPPRSML